MLWLTMALAAETGIVVQFAATGVTIEDEVVCLLTADGETAEIALNDSGEVPDVAAADGRWSGAIMVTGNDFDVVIIVDGEQHAAGSVSWDDDGSPRDLVLAYEDGNYTASAGRGANAPPDGMGSPDAPPGEGLPVDPSEGGAPTELAEGRPLEPGGVGPTPPDGIAPVSMPSAATGGSNDSTLLIGLGMGLLVLAGIVFMWLRRGGGAGYRVKTRATLQPEPPFLGQGGPVLSQGLQAVKVSGDPKELAVALLPGLARDHRVLVAGLDSVPAVWGGPVYLADSIKPVHVGDAAEDLLAAPGMPLVLLAVGIADLNDQLPDGVGGLVLGTEGELSAEKGDEGWTLAGLPV